ncbi:hypothetical protein [Bacillus licheniformis]|nr:hypothetical protein [Bacillus licheniformis]TWK51987.1 hypothetical protein CHCC20344_0802 [Bacillus licheniformis]TWM49954.1 hypothetical protein CHCC14816_4458 [Bacillus licheniformis]
MTREEIENMIADLEFEIDTHEDEIEDLRDDIRYLEDKIEAA